MVWRDAIVKWLVAFVSLLLMAQGPAPRVPPINVPSATGVSASDTAALQGALNTAVGQGGGTVYVPKGTYAIARILLIGGNTTLVCAPGTLFQPIDRTTYIANSPTFGNPPLFGGATVVGNVHNQDFAYTDKNIVIQDCGVDYSVWPAGSAHASFTFQSAQHVHIIRPQCINGPGDCTAMIHTDDTWVENGYAQNVRSGSACWDHFYGWTNAHIIGGVCSAQTYGILFTGTNTDESAPFMGQYAEVSGGTYFVTGVNGAGIWIQGCGSNGPGCAGSGVQHVRVNGIYMNLSGTTTTGFESSGQNSDIIFSNSVVRELPRMRLL